MLGHHQEYIDSQCAPDDDPQKKISFIFDPPNMYHYIISLFNDFNGNRQKKTGRKFVQMPICFYFQCSELIRF